MQTPSLALCQLAFPHTTFADDLEIAPAVGAHGLSVFESKVDRERADDQASAMRRAGLATALAIPELWTILTAPGKMLEGQPTTVDERVAAIADAIRLLATFEPHAVMLCTGPAGDDGEEAARRAVSEAVGELSKVARAAGTRLALEPMRESYRGVRTILTSLAETVAFLDDGGHDDVGIVVDTWHLWDSPDFLADLGRVINRVDTVQIADYRDPTRGRMDRVVAGDGLARIPAVLATLEELGYDGWYDLEVFSDDGRFGEDHPDSLWKLPPLEFARRQVEGFMDCYRASPDDAVPPTDRR